MATKAATKVAKQVVKKITFLDKAFWLTETNHSPKHVASLQILELPENASESYLSDFVKELRQFDTGVSPFNCTVSTFLGYPLKLKPLDKLDMDYHLKEHELDDISDKESLNKLVATLHETRLDTDKPLWQYHLIKSVKGDEFVLYAKIHHMYGDGATLVRWFLAAYNEEPSSENFTPIWANENSRKHKPGKLSIKGILLGIVGFFWAVKDFLWILFRILLKLIRVNKDYMPVPFTGTKTVLTGQVKKGRVVTTLDLPFTRIYALSKRLRATINEVMLCCFDIGTHRFLKEHGQTFDKALFTNMPINLRKPGDKSSGNKIAIVPVELAHGETDPYLRLRQIIENHRVVIKAAKSSHPAAFSYYTIFIQSFSLVYELLHVSDWVKPIANILVSNMPGPREARYFKDCKLKAVYPISTITPGGGVNITLMTYGDKSNVGIVCCDTNIKTLEPLAQYFKEAFDLLEKSVDDLTLSTDDIGEYVDEKDSSKIVEAKAYDDWFPMG